MGYTTKLNVVHGSTIQLIVPTSVVSQLNPYVVEFNCRIEGMNEWEGQSRITEVNSPSHPIQVYFLEQNTYMVTFSQQNTYSNRDILINIELAVATPEPSITKTTSDLFEGNSHLTTYDSVHSNYVHSPINILTTNTVGQPFDYYCVLDFEAVCHQVDPNLKRPSPNDTWEIH